MHRSSESVAAIATALAKAQTELSNPEKAMVGTVYSVRSDSPHSFRYASLSSGLDIIRKTLGGQQIAIAQTTDIDRANGMVNRGESRRRVVMARPISVASSSTSASNKVLAAIASVTRIMAGVISRVSPSCHDCRSRAAAVVITVAYSARRWR